MTTKTDSDADLAAVPVPVPEFDVCRRVKLSQEPVRDSGRGLLLIRSYMDKVEYSEKGNAILMVKNKTK
ncbi:MAG: ATP-binding protein, partial [Acidobacteriota bacterium]